MIISLPVRPLLAAVLLSPALGAEESNPVSTAPTTSLPARFRDAIAAKLPKYVPAAPAKPAPTTFAREPTDDPGVVRLPEFKVNAPKLLGTEITYLTPKGMRDLAFKNAPGLRIGNLFNMNQDIAHDILMDDRLAADRADMQDKVLRTSLPGAAESKENVRLMRDASLQPNTEWGTHNAGYDRK